MRRFRIWLYAHFLPAWAKDSVYRENAALREKIGEQEQEIRRLHAYIDGLETALHAMRRIVIHTGGGV